MLTNPEPRNESEVIEEAKLRIPTPWLVREKCPDCGETKLWVNRLFYELLPWRAKPQGEMSIIEGLFFTDDRVLVNAVSRLMFKEDDSQ